MRQYRITTANLTPQSENDCVLSPDDPIHGLMASSTLGGLGSEAALAQYLNAGTPVVQGSDKGRVAREQNIKPGTEAWFKHWFGKTNPTGGN
jgi:hypothetical protein